MLLRGAGYVTLLAFPAAVMPAGWMTSIADWTGAGPLAADPLSFYLARNLSLMYGFVGVGVLYIGWNLDRYRSLVRPLSFAMIAFGASQLIVDAQAGMPWWWTLGESLSTIVGGGIVYWLDSAAAKSQPKSE